MILLLHGAPAFGAVESYVVDVARGLRVQGREVTLAFPDVPELAPFHELAADGVVLKPLAPNAVRESAPALLRELIALIRATNPSVVHVTDVWPPAQLAARLSGRRLLLTHHTPELVTSDNIAGRVWRWLGWAVRPEVIYTSESDRATDGRSLRTHVVYYGIDLERFDSPHAALRHDGPIVGNVARLAEQKGLDVLVDAAPEVLKEHPETLFVLVGEGEERGALERRIADSGLERNFLLTGLRHDVPELLASFDVFALPSRFEGLCYAVIEAQAVGVPVVATSVGGVGENVVPGETGILCTVDDPHSLARGIVHLLDHPDEGRALATEARRRAQARYDRARMVAETIALYG